MDLEMAFGAFRTVIYQYHGSESPTFSHFVVGKI
jgi:hypothetical protein